MGKYRESELATPHENCQGKKIKRLGSPVEANSMAASDTRANITLQPLR